MGELRGSGALRPFVSSASLQLRRLNFCQANALSPPLCSCQTSTSTRYQAWCPWKHSTWKTVKHTQQVLAVAWPGQVSHQVSKPPSLVGLHSTTVILSLFFPQSAKDATWYSHSPSFYLQSCQLDLQGLSMPVTVSSGCLFCLPSTLEKPCIPWQFCKEMDRWITRKDWGRNKGRFREISPNELQLGQITANILHFLQPKQSPQVLKVKVLTWKTHGWSPGYQKEELLTAMPSHAACWPKSKKLSHIFTVHPTFPCQHFANTVLFSRM